MSLLRDYSNQARTYDETRAASPSVLGPLREALVGAPGNRLADIGGGTGNYSMALKAEGWDPIVIDREPAMLARARAKGLETLEADAQALPLPDESVDAVMLVSMLHHVEDPPKALQEARRILRPQGKLALMVFTREDLEGVWYSDYFPSTRPWVAASHPSQAALQAHLPGSHAIEIVYEDLEDASLSALANHPELLVDPAWNRQTSYFERLARDHPEELAAGLERLKRELEDGTAPRQKGRGTVLAYTRTRPASSAHSSAAR
jgi:ubiquinone/menaquinone biosynthesis C-methylase UbiE